MRKVERIQVKEQNEILERKLQEVRKIDKNWKWKATASKDETRIDWGYLTYLNEEEPFKIKYDDEILNEYIAISPYGQYLEAGTYEECIDAITYNAMHCW